MKKILYPWDIGEEAAKLKLKNFINGSASAFKATMKLTGFVFNLIIIISP